MKKMFLIFGIFVFLPTAFPIPDATNVFEAVRTGNLAGVRALIESDSRLLQEKDGTWGKPRDLSAVVHGDGEMNMDCPGISRDGKFLFFAGSFDNIIEDNENPFWIDAAVIEDARPGIRPGFTGPAAGEQTKFVPASVAFTVGEIDLIPEGIAHDSRTGRFFLSSLFKEKVVAVDAGGGASDFVPSGKDGIMEGLGLKVDEERRRLWVVSNKAIDGRCFSAVHVFDADSGNLIKKLALEQKKPQLLNDLVLLRDGSAYITDTDAYRVYRVPADLSRIDIFLPSDELLNSANGIAASPDGAILYVAAAKHIILVDIRRKEMHPIGNPSAFPDSGIDGLCYHRGGLVAVVNEVKTLQDVHIARYALSPDGREIRSRTIIDQGNPLFDVPTTAVIAGDDLYCLAVNSLGVYLRNQMSEREKLKKPAVLKYRLCLDGK